MTEMTVRRAIRYFIVTELMAAVVVGVGFVLDQNGYIISVGLLFMIGGMVFLAYAGNLKAQQRMLEAMEKARREQGSEMRGPDWRHKETDNSRADDPGSIQHEQET